MDGPVFHIDSPSSQEKLHSLRVFEVKENLGTLVFQSFVALPNGENEAEDIIEGYENSSIVKSFDELFTFLVQSEHILSYSVFQLEQFYKFHFIASSFDSYLAIFDKGPFVNSFTSLSEGKRQKYIASQDKYAPVPFREFYIVKQILDKMRLFENLYLVPQFSPVYIERET